MKRTMIKTIGMGVLIFGSLAEGYGMNNAPEEKYPKIARVTFEEVNSGDKLRIKGYDGQTHYRERIKADGSFTKRFDVSELPEDQYYFEVDKDDEITVLPFSVSEEKVDLQNDLKANIAKPHLATYKDQVILTRDAEDAQTIAVDIYFKGRNIYSEEVEKNGKLSRQYDFSKSMNGTYLFEIKYDDRLYSEFVNVR